MIRVAPRSILFQVPVWDQSHFFENAVDLSGQIGVPGLGKEKRPPELRLTAARKLAPRAGLEPATRRLQVPQHFSWAWTISSPAPPK